MPGDTYYHTAQWRRMRAQVLARDHHTCVVPGCGLTARVVDHVVSRRNGGTDSLANLRSLCGFHDGQIKELRTGKRRNNGLLTVTGTDRRGVPLDPGHHWHRR